jgi:hypothetical protein
MGTIVKLPNAKPKRRPKLEDILVEKLSDYESHTNIGDIRFTCATCGNVSHFKFDHAVFKTCELYCSSCGTGYKINNPLFVNDNKVKFK